MLKLETKLTDTDRKQLAAEDEKKRAHYAGECDDYCWLCEEARALADDALGG